MGGEFILLEKYKIKKKKTSSEIHTTMTASPWRRDYNLMAALSGWAALLYLASSKVYDQTSDAEMFNVTRQLHLSRRRLY